MVNRNLITIAIGVILSGVATAANCGNGFYYCGTSLLNKGNYYGDIVNSLTEAGEPNAETNINQSLFYCKGAHDIPFVKFCEGGCHDAGTGKSDSCN
ncbi:hypothetical protein F4806DRAFT_481759 [Annulohypoxylon nitens]|nr:hypothetical protein F4806DRAFT_481759 [Annulohypoxylon nitens]